MDRGNMGHGNMGQSGGSMQGGNMAQMMQQCIQECQACHNSCVQTLTYCLQQGGKHVEANHITALLDCAETCQISANFMLRGSQLHSQVCGVCAEACARCAQSCEQMGNDAQLQACAQECRRCEESCRQMASMK